MAKTITKSGPKGPTKYTPEKIQELTENLLNWTYENTGEHFLLERWATENRVPPSAISMELIKDEQFSEALEMAKQNQKWQLQEGGLTSKFNSTITKLLLMSNHGMTEKTETTAKEHIDKDIDGLLNKEYGTE